MSRIILVVLSLIVSFVAIVCMAATAAYAAPAAPKGVSAEFLSALKGVQCSELNEGDWAIKGEAGEALERLDENEAIMFDTLMAKWAKKACKPTTNAKGE